MTDARKALVEEAKRIDAASTPGPWGEDDGNVFCRPLADARHEACVAKVEGRPYEADHLAFDAFVCTTEQRHPESDADATFIARARTLMMELAVALEASERERDHADVRLAGVEEERDHYRQALAASKWCDKHAVAQPCQFCPDERIVKRLEEETTLRSNLQQQLAVAESALDWHKREASRFAALVTQEHAKRIDVERERDSALAALAKARKDCSCSGVRVFGTTSLRCTMMSPVPRPCRRGKPLPRKLMVSPGCVPTGISTSMSPSREGVFTVAPRAACGNESATRVCKSAPSRSKRGSSATSTST